jgi:hypothetical protein
MIKGAINLMKLNSMLTPYRYRWGKMLLSGEVLLNVVAKEGYVLARVE